MTLKNNFELMAKYNQWINVQFYQAAKNLPQEKLDQDLGAYFSSISGTLNHILVGDILWLKRFAGHPANFTSLDSLQGFDTPPSLDQQLYKSFEELQQNRKKIDEIIRSLCGQIQEIDLDHKLSYNNSEGLPFHKNFGSLLQHLFNHQTHHRGQISTLLYQQGVDVGATDLLMKIPD